MSDAKNSITVYMTAEEREHFKQMQTAMAKQPAEPRLELLFQHAIKQTIDPKHRELMRNAKVIKSVDSLFFHLENRRYARQSKYPSNVAQSGSPPPPISRPFLERFFGEYGRRLNALAVLENQAAVATSSPARFGPLSQPCNSNSLEAELVALLPFSQEEVQATWQFLAAHRARNGLGLVGSRPFVFATAHQLLDRVLGEKAEELRFERWIDAQHQCSVDVHNCFQLRSQWDRLPSAIELQALIEMERASTLAQMPNPGADSPTTIDHSEMSATVVQDRSTDAETSERPPTQIARSKGQSWKTARKSLMALLRVHRLPGSIRQAAKVIDIGYNTTRRAVVKSTVLSEHFEVKTSAKLSDRLFEIRELASVNRLFDTMNPEQLQKAEQWIFRLSAAEFLVLYTSVEKNPGSIQRGLASIIENTDRQADEE